MSSTKLRTARLVMLESGSLVCPSFLVSTWRHHLGSHLSVKSTSLSMSIPIERELLCR